MDTITRLHEMLNVDLQKLAAGNSPKRRAAARSELHRRERARLLGMLRVGDRVRVIIGNPGGCYTVAVGTVTERAPGGEFAQVAFPVRDGCATQSVAFRRDHRSGSYVGYHGAISAHLEPDE